MAGCVASCLACSARGLTSAVLTLARYKYKIFLLIFFLHLLVQVDSGNGNVVSNKRMAPKQKKNPTKKTKKTVKKGAPKKNATKKTKKTVKKGAPKQTSEKQLGKMGKRHEKIEMQYEKLEEKMEEGREKMEEQVEELKESLEEHVQDGAAHQIEEQLEQLKESLEEHVEDGAAHPQLKDKLEEGEESSSSSEGSEDEDDEVSTTDWLRGKMSGLFGSRTHFGSAHSRQVEIQDL